MTVYEPDVLRLANHAIANLLVSMEADDDGVVLWANDAAQRLFGYTYGELEGLKVEALVPPSFRKGHPALRKAFRDNPGIRPMGVGRPVRGVRKDGSEFTAAVMLAPAKLYRRAVVLVAVFDMSRTGAHGVEP